MIATSPQPQRDARRADDDATGRAASPDIDHFRRRYPATVASLGALPRREEWLRRIWKTDQEWREANETRGGRAAATEEVLVRSAPPAGREVEGEFDVVYAGGALGLLHAGVMACRFNRRVLVLEDGEAALSEGAWNISDDELKELERAGLLSPDESESVIVNRYSGGFVKFHDAASRIKAEPLWTSGVLDVAVDGERIKSLVAERIAREGAEGSRVLVGFRFVRAYIERHRVTVETEGADGERRLFSARLFVDATEAGSPVVRQLNETALTHVRPTVGTISSGYARGPARDEVDFQTGEILVSTEDASDHRQLIWDGFAANRERDEYATRLFFYDAVNSPADKSLLSLFERYFETLPAYKRRGASWRVRRPVFGHVPVFQTGRGWRSARSLAADRVLAIGETASTSSPLGFRGTGAHIGELRRLARLTERALASDATDARSLAELCARKPRVAQTLMLAEFMRPTPKGAPSAVNETFNAMMAALHKLDERVRQELFQDRLSFGALRSLIGHTARIYPRIFARVRERLGARGTLWWLSDVFEAMRSERRARREAGED